MKFKGGGNAIYPLPSASASDNHVVFWDKIVFSLQMHHSVDFSEYVHMCIVVFERLKIFFELKYTKYKRSFWK